MKEAVVKVAADISLIFLSLYFRNWFSARFVHQQQVKDPKSQHNLLRTHSCVKTTHSSLIANEVARFCGIVCVFLWRTDKNSHSNFPGRLLLFLGPGRPLQTSILAREPRYVLDELHTHTHTLTHTHTHTLPYSVQKHSPAVKGRFSK